MSQSETSFNALGYTDKRRPIVEAKDAGQNTCLWGITIRVNAVSQGCTSAFAGRRKTLLLIIPLSAEPYALIDSQI